MVNKNGQSRHKVRQAVFELKYPDEKMALDGRDPAAKLFKNTLLPALDEIFEAYMPNGRVYRIDELKLDLGKVNLEKPDFSVLHSTIRAQVMTQLGATLEIQTASTSPEQAFVDTLVTFGQTGIWPWDAPFGDTSTLEAVVLEGSSLENSIILQFLQLNLLPLLAKTAVRQRLVYQFSPAFIIWLIKALNPDQADDVISLQGNVNSEQASMALLMAVQQLSAENSLTEAFLEMPSASADAEQSKPAAELHVQHAGIVLLHPYMETFFDKFSLLKERNQTGSRQFCSSEAQVRAVHLLHYLARGEENPDEPLTTLFKVLCNVSTAQPLPKRLSLRTDEKQECDRLLTAVIGHWKKLGSTSPDGLRESFLQREGLLVHQDDSWKLTVEQRGIDILLGYIPWGISLVRLPWTAEPIWVDWA